MMEETGITIRDARRKLHWTQLELAVKADLSLPVISRMERGKPVNIGSFRRVCKELGINPDHVLGVNTGSRRG